VLLAFIALTLYRFGLGILIWSICLLFYGAAVIRLWSSNSKKQRILAAILMPALLIFSRPAKKFRLPDKDG